MGFKLWGDIAVPFAAALVLFCVLEKVVTHELAGVASFLSNEPDLVSGASVRDKIFNIVADGVATIMG
jgi:hypothetical protein